METNAKHELLMGISVISFLLAIVAVIAVILFLIFRTASKKYKAKPKKIYIILPFVLVFIAAASFICNPGWYRVFLIIFPLPIFHSLLFFYVSIYAATFTVQKSKLNTYIIISYISYTLTYLLFPDGGDYGEMYFFFTLIQSNKLSETAMSISGIALTVNILFIILQFIEARRLKKLAKKNDMPNSN